MSILLGCTFGPTFVSEKVVVILSLIIVIHQAMYCWQTAAHSIIIIVFVSIYPITKRRQQADIVIHFLILLLILLLCWRQQKTTTGLVFVLLNYIFQWTKWGKKWTVLISKKVKQASFFRSTRSIYHDVLIRNVFKICSASKTSFRTQSIFQLWICLNIRFL